MKQKKFYGILLKYQAGQCTKDKGNRTEWWPKNLQSPKEIANLIKSKSQIFENINAGLKKEAKTPYQWMAAEACRIKIVFNKNKFSSCLLRINLKVEDLFSQLQAVCHTGGRPGGRQCGSS